MSRAKGPLGGFEVVKVKMTLEDGTYHAVDSSDLAFQVCARDAFKEALLKAKPALLEPIMLVEVETPSAFQGGVIGDLSSRRGYIAETEVKGNTAILRAEVPLANMFGYATDVRSATQGQATFTMVFHQYRQVPPNVQMEILENLKKEAKAK
jgi:elongation factor G